MELLVTEHSLGAPQPSGGLGFLFTVWVYKEEQAASWESQTNYILGMDVVLRENCSEQAVG